MPEKQLPAYLDLVLLTLAILGGYLWLQISWLQPYSLQGFALAILLFFGMKFFSKHRHQTLPQMATFELVPLIFSLILLVGSSNAAQSSYFALLYIFLLLLVLTSTLTTAVVVTAQVVFVLYALSIQFEASDWRQLLSLPLMLGFFLYIKYQLAVTSQQQTQLQEREQALEQVSTQKLTLERFVGDFLKPKLATLLRLGQDQQTSKQVLLSQIDLLENEIDKILARPEQQAGHFSGESSDQSSTQLPRHASGDQTEQMSEKVSVAPDEPTTKPETGQIV